MSYCIVHTDYKTTRRPKTKCHSCWRLYLEASNLSVEDYIESLNKKEKDLADWLRVNIDDIIYAPLAEGFSKSFFEFVENP